MSQKVQERFKLKTEELQRIIGLASQEADAKAKGNKIIELMGDRWADVTDDDITSLVQAISATSSMVRTTWTTRLKRYRDGLDTAKACSINLSELGPVAEKNGRLFWFRYYWQECQNTPNRSTADATTMANAFNAFFSPDRDVRLGIHPLKKPEQQWDDARTLFHLEKLLEITCVKFPGNDTAYAARDTSDTLIANFLRNRSDTMDVGYGWRSDYRSYQNIVASAGFQAQAASDSWARENGMREPWHPFSKASNREWLWYRKGQDDNCLYTVVSVSEEGDWHTNVTFPETDLLKDANKVLDVEAQCLVNGKPAIRTLKATISWVYMFLISGIVLNTEGVQRAKGAPTFPEKGMKEIPVNNIFGAVQFIRFHHGNGKDAGLTAIPIKESVTESVSGRFSVKSRYGDDLYRKLSLIFSDTIIGNKPLSVRWTPTGYAPINSKFKFNGQGDEIEVQSLTPASKTRLMGKSVFDLQ